MSEALPANPAPFDPFGVHDSERVYDSAWCGLRRDTVILPNGRHQEYHVFEVSDAAVVVPVLPDGSIVLLGQYRYPHGKTHWEVPAGRIGEGETPAGAIERELLEETGYSAGQLHPLPGFYPTNGISAHYAHAFYALDCARVTAPQPEDSEQIMVKVHTRAEVRALLRAGLIQDGFSALSLLYYLDLAHAPD
ncbi:MAG: 8-oxo-dGTP pyrophosphatase MutT (NUDIX family) [Chlamydiales bacterium]|jgi:8-oxo-dGTP pyrophosphatase MutT (NUDIX family)